MRNKVEGGGYGVKALKSHGGNIKMPVKLSLGKKIQKNKGKINVEVYMHMQSLIGNRQSA